MIRRLLGVFNLMPKADSEAVIKQKEAKGECVTMVSPSGKEVLIDSKWIANHIQRGFTIK